MAGGNGWTRRGVLMGLVWVTLAAFAGDGAWRSRLYPEEWTPEFTGDAGHFLHDVSYAGYRNGAVPIPDIPGPLFNIVSAFGADPAGGADATPAIRSAIEAAAAAGGGVVFIPPGLYRCDGALRIAASRIVLRGAGPEVSRLVFTSVPEQGWSDHVTVRGGLAEGGEALLSEDGSPRSATVATAGGGAFRPGDDVSVGWVITDDFIREHGMEGTWKSFNGKWRPFFLRTVRALPGDGRVTLDVPLRYPAKVRDGASVRAVTGYVSECGIESLGIANAVSRKASWSRAGVHAIAFDGVKDCWIRDVRSFPSPFAEAGGFHLQNGGIFVCRSKRVTVDRCVMEKARNRGGGGSGYLFEVSRSGEILTRDCRASEGRHNFIQNWDFGTSGCVWLRCESRGGRGYANELDPIGWTGYSEFHHSLAMACLIDSCRLDDGWFAGNRNDWSSGAGHTVTQTVFWNTSGEGVIRSWQAGVGYIIGTDGVRVETDLRGANARGTEPEDFVEGLGDGARLVPRSLYEDQLRRRLAHP